MNRSILIILIVVFAILGIGTMGFVLDKCGPKGLLLGNGAFAAAAMGMCDE